MRDPGSAPPPTRIAVVGSCSGQGKTTLARQLADRVGGQFVEFDALRNGPEWTLTPDEQLRATLAPVVASERWAIDVVAEKILGRLILDRVQLIVWLDLPPWVWFPRLIRRSGRRLLRDEVLWNGNRETVRGVFFERDGVFPHAFRRYFLSRGDLQAQLQRYALEGVPLVRLGRPAEVDAFLDSFPATPGKTLR